MTSPTRQNPTAANNKNTKNTTAMMRGGQADSARRRQRVIAAINKATADGTGALGAAEGFNRT